MSAHLPGGPPPPQQVQMSIANSLGIPCFKTADSETTCYFGHAVSAETAHIRPPDAPPENRTEGNKNSAKPVTACLSIVTFCVILCYLLCRCLRTVHASWVQARLYLPRIAAACGPPVQVSDACQPMPLQVELTGRSVTRKRYCSVQGCRCRDSAARGALSNTKRGAGGGESTAQHTTRQGAAHAAARLRGGRHARPARRPA